MKHSKHRKSIMQLCLLTINSVSKLYAHWHSQVGDLNSGKMLSSDKIKFIHTKEPSSFSLLAK